MLFLKKKCLKSLISPAVRSSLKRKKKTLAGMDGLPIKTKIMGQNYGDCPLTLTKFMYWQFTGKLTLRGKADRFNFCLNWLIHFFFFFTAYEPLIFV